MQSALLAWLLFHSALWTSWDLILPIWNFPPQFVHFVFPLQTQYCRNSLTDLSLFTFYLLLLLVNDSLNSSPVLKGSGSLLCKRLSLLGSFFCHIKLLVKMLTLLDARAVLVLSQDWGWSSEVSSLTADCSSCPTH